METEEPATTDNVDNFEKEPSEKQMNEEAPEEVNGNEYIEEPTEEGNNLLLQISNFFCDQKESFERNWTPDL